MKTSFSCDASQAARVEASASINQSGAYVGQILQAESYMTTGGAQMLRFMFQTAEKSSAWIDLCIGKKDGTDAFGIGYLHAILCVTGTQDAKIIPYRVYDRNGMAKEGFRMLEIEKKPVGFVLQREEEMYEKDGEQRIGYRMKLVRVFNAQTNQTASEMKQNKPARKIEAFLAQLKDKKVKQAADNFETKQAPHAKHETVDDDIPF